MLMVPVAAEASPFHGGTSVFWNEEQHRRMDSV